MSDIWIVSIPILLVDVTNPILFASVIMTLSASNPLARSSALILGHTVAYFVVGLLVIYGLAEVLAPVMDFVVDGFVNPAPLNFAIGLMLGVLLIALSLKMVLGAAPSRDAPEEKAESGGVVSSFMLGVTIKLVGIPFALPYYGFINELFRFDIASKPTALLIYNLGYALPFALLPLAFAVWGTGIIGQLKAINQFLVDVSSWLMPVLFGLLGATFVVDAVKFFLTGSGII